jgi:hypothetical protein
MATLPQARKLMAKITLEDLTAALSEHEEMSRPIGRHELRYEQWRLIESLLPVLPRMGRPRIDDRAALNGML